MYIYIYRYIYKQHMIFIDILGLPEMGDVTTNKRIGDKWNMMGYDEIYHRQRDFCVCLQMGECPPPVTSIR